MYNNFTESNDIYQSCTIVVPSTQSMGSILIGDFNSATDSQTIKKYNIKTIITAATGMQHLQVPPHVLHIIYPLLDASTEDISKFFDESTQTIKKNLSKGSVLVHCAAGISRSTTLVLAYLMKTRNMTFREAISMVRAKRKKVCPNLGFQRQLKKYQKQLQNYQPQRKNLLKKTISEKLSDQRRTSYNSSHHIHRSNNINDYFKFEPRTAGESVRRRNQISKKSNVGHSYSRARQRKNFNVRAINKDSMMVLGAKKQSISISEKNCHPNAVNNNWAGYNNSWGKMKRFKMGN